MSFHRPSEIMLVCLSASRPPFSKFKEEHSLELSVIHCRTCIFCVSAWVPYKVMEKLCSGLTGALYQDIHRWVSDDGDWQRDLAWPTAQIRLRTQPVLWGALELRWAFKAGLTWAKGAVPSYPFIRHRGHGLPSHFWEGGSLQLRTIPPEARSCVCQKLGDGLELGV